MMWTIPTGERIHGFLKKNELIREDGRIERICEHGVGHPIGHLYKWEKWMGTHGCCGCCFSATFYINEAINVKTP